MYATIYDISKGLNFITLVMISKRDLKLVDKHYNITLFPPTEQNVTSHCRAEL